MSIQRNKQIRRLISSAPTNSHRNRHVHFREIQSDEPKRRCEGQSYTTWSTLQKNATFLRQDTDESSTPASYTHSLSSISHTTINTPGSTELAHSQSFYSLPDDLLARGDFIAYQSGNVSDFFNTPRHTRPQRISEICLVNDHYILVKIPEPRQDHYPNMETIAEEESSSTMAAGGEQGQSELFRCFSRQKNRRVSPASVALDSRAMKSISNGIASKTSTLFQCPPCWRLNEKPEVFESQTKLFGVFWKQKLPSQVITIQPSKGDVGAAPLDLSVKSARNSIIIADAARVHNKQVDAEVFGSPLNTPTKLQPNPDFRSPLQTSLHESVTLEQHTAWINDEAGVREQDKSSPLTQNKMKKTKRRSGIFHWFLKRPKVSKPKSKIHAVVYKTYFVRWKKPPDDERCPHCGQQRNTETPTAASCKWRRCHSAVF